MKKQKQLKNWDYNLPKNFQPQNDYQWRWFLERRINYDQFRGLDIKQVKRYLPTLKIDEGKRLLLKAYFKHYGQKI